MTLADVSDVALGQAEAAARAEGLALATVRVDVLASPPPAGPWDCGEFQGCAPLRLAPVA